MNLPRCVAEAVVRASKEFAYKEEIRKRVQDIVTNAVKTGRVKDQKGLDELFSSIEMACLALKNVPLEAYKR